MSKGRLTKQHRPPSYTASLKGKKIHHYSLHIIRFTHGDLDCCRARIIILRVSTLILIPGSNHTALMETSSHQQGHPSQTGKPDPSEGSTREQMQLPDHQAAAATTDGISDHPPPDLSPGRAAKRPLSRKCLLRGKAVGRFLVLVLRMVWLDVVFLLLVLGATWAVLRWLPIPWAGNRLFAVYYDAFAAQWHGPQELSYPLARHPPRPELTIKPPILDGPRFIVPIIPFAAGLPIGVGLILILMQIWVRSGWDKLAALFGLYKALATV